MMAPTETFDGPRGTSIAQIASGPCNRPDCFAKSHGPRRREPYRCRFADRRRLDVNLRIVLACIGVFILLPGCVAASGQTPGGIKQENVGLKAELSAVRNDLTARDAEIVGLKTTVEARDVEIVGLKKEAGRDINNPWIPVAAIVLLGLEAPALLLVYMGANRVRPLRRIKDWVKGRCDEPVPVSDRQDLAWFRSRVADLEAGRDVLKRERDMLRRQHDGLERDFHVAMDRLNAAEDRLEARARPGPSGTPVRSPSGGEMPTSSG